MKWWKPSTWFKPRPIEHRSPLQKHDPWEQRSRFQQAMPNRLTRDRFTVQGTQSINTDLHAHLKTLMGRCSLECAINPDFEGIVKTYCTHVVGKVGPTLQVTSSSKSFNEAVETAWKQVFTMPDPAGRMSGTQSLRLSVRMLLVAGSFLNVYGTCRRPGPVTFGWKTIHPRRLVNPASAAGDPLVNFGIRTNEEGTPLEYYIEDSGNAIGGIPVGHKTRAYPAEVVQHGFAFVEPEQITGFPWMTPGLDSASMLRELDEDVAQAYKDQVNHSYGLEAKTPEAVIDPDPMPADGYTVERGQATAAPLGWAWKHFPPTHPSAQHREFRHELVGKMARPIHMPLIMALLSAVDSNFASAQFEGTIYADGVSETQTLLDNASLIPAVEEVITELVIGGVTARPRGGYQLAFSWPKPPHANIEKFVKAIRTLIEDRVISRSMAISMMGYDPDEVYRSCQRDSELSEEYGQPEPPVNHGSGSAPDTMTAGDASQPENSDAELVTA